MVDGEVGLFAMWNGLRGIENEIPHARNTGVRDDTAMVNV
jgi:hypothetical protein